MLDLSAIARHRRRIPVRLAARLCERFLDAYHNLDYRAHRNGEEHVVRTLGRFGMHTVFDVGANVGQWALMAEPHLPDARIHCFEITPDTQDRLRENVAGHDRITVHGFGLGRADGTLTVRYAPSSPESATVTDYPLPADCREIPARVRHGESFAREFGVDRIDLLKVDVEGMEADVLDGFEGMLAAGAIDVIQFEYGRVNLLTRQLLGGFYDRLGGHGYDLGKIYPTYVDFRPYLLTDEDFRGPNFLAVLKRRPDMIRALGSP